MNKSSNKFSPEVRERAVRMVHEHRGEYPSLWAAIESIAPKIGCVPQTLNQWVRRHEVDTGARHGVTTDERERVKHWNGRLRNCAGPMRSLRRRVLFSPRRSSTADSRVEGLHRPLPGHLWGRADLQGLADRPVVLQTPRSPTAQPGLALHPGKARRASDARYSTGLARQHAGLWC